MLSPEEQKQRLEKIKELYASGLSQEEVGQVLGLSRSSIVRLMKVNGIVARKSHEGCKGDRNHNWKGSKAHMPQFMLESTGYGECQINVNNAERKRQNVTNGQI